MADKVQSQIDAIMTKLFYYNDSQNNLARFLQNRDIAEKFIREKVKMIEDTINAQKFFGVELPIFIDDAESHRRSGSFENRC